MNLVNRLKRLIGQHLSSLAEGTSLQRDLIAEVRLLRSEILGLKGARSDEGGGGAALQQTLSSIQQDILLLRLVSQSDQMGRLMGAAGRYADPRSLSRFATRVYSQVGEDGIIAEVFSRIGYTNRRFIEIGIGDGRENTTRFLLETGWSGTWVEGSPENVRKARTLMADFISAGRLKIVEAFVTAENIEQILDDAGAPTEVDYLSLDVDYNTPHIWRALGRRPRLACIEYNAHLPRSLAMSVPYDPAGVWDGSLWYGGSLKLMEVIGREKGMALVGCDLMGVNAFFVAQSELGNRFLPPFDAETHFEPPRYHAFGAPRHFGPDQPRKWAIEAA